MPIITAGANSRPWVHQEIGYATALSVPVLPLAIGELPEGLIRDLHGKRLGPDLAELSRVLTRRAIDTLVSRAELSSRTPAECALTPQERTLRIVQLAERVRDFGSLARVRQRGGLGTFSIPRKTVIHPIWRQRDGETERTQEYRELQRQERLILEHHALAAGCDLVLDPTALLNTHGPQARAARFQTVLEFLEGMPDDKVRVVLQEGLDPGNLIIVGDYYAAESLAPRLGRGYFQTVFTLHGPTVLRRTLEFDEQFVDLLGEAPRQPDESSRTAAIRNMRALLASTVG